MASHYLVSLFSWHITMLLSILKKTQLKTMDTFTDYWTTSSLNANPRKLKRHGSPLYQIREGERLCKVLISLDRKETEGKWL